MRYTFGGTAPVPLSSYSDSTVYKCRLRRELPALFKLLARSPPS